MAKLTMNEYCELLKEFRSMPIDRVKDISDMLLGELKLRLPEANESSAQVSQTC